MAKSQIIRGRNIVWLIHDWFQLNPETKPLYGLQAITDIKW